MLHIPDTNATQTQHKHDRNVVCVEQKRNKNFSVIATVPSYTQEYILVNHEAMPLPPLHFHPVVPFSPLVTLSCPFTYMYASHPNYNNSVPSSRTSDCAPSPLHFHPRPFYTFLPTRCTSMPPFTLLCPTITLLFPCCTSMHSSHPLPSIMTPWPIALLAVPTPPHTLHMCLASRPCRPPIGNAAQ